ncbi:MAG: hypothetical protein J1E81_03265 [Eubacterium sp.]|nr:hypothetical protein [Eubacterium sp.]
MKKAFSLFLALVMLLSIMAGIDLSAYADESIFMEVGETRTLYAQTYGRSISSGYWTTNNSKAVEIVSQGYTSCTVRALQTNPNEFNKAYVEFRYQYKVQPSGYMATGMYGFNITVESIEPTSVQISPSSLTLSKGEGYQLSALVYPSNSGQTLTWNTSDINILSVNNGYVYAHNYGSAYVIATASNGVYAMCYVTVECPNHKYKKKKTKATTSKNGKIVTKCTVCGKVKSKTTIYYPKTVKLSKSSYIYDGKVKKPKVTVINSKGKEIDASKYTVSYSKGRKNAGKYKVKVKFKDDSNYTGTITKTFKIKPNAKVTLSSISYVYNGKTRKPKVTVKDLNGNKISSKNYTVTYPKGRKAVGKYTVKVKLKGKYNGTVKKTFKIVPKKTYVSKLTAKSKGFVVKWKKNTTQTTGYQIQYAIDSKFSSKKTVTVKNNKTTSKTILHRKANKKYYVRIRTYKTVKVNGKSTKIYSSWSKVKTVTTKK